VWDSFRDCSPPLVVLAACHSKAVGVALVAAGVRHVVATTDEVATGAAMAFTRRFYTELVRGASIHAAFAVAVLAIADVHQRSIMVLLPAGGDHSVRALPCRCETPQWCDCACVPSECVNVSVCVRAW
jgi:hypothetical protein